MKKKDYEIDKDDNGSNNSNDIIKHNIIVRSNSKPGHLEKKLSKR